MDRDSPVPQDDACDDVLGGDSPSPCPSQALMQRDSLRYAARLDASGAMPEPIQVILFLHFDLIRSNKSIIRCYIL